MSKGLGKYMGQMMISVHREKRHVGLISWLREDGRMRLHDVGDFETYDYYVIDRFENDPFNFSIGMPFDIESLVERDISLKRSIAIGSSITESLGIGDAAAFASGGMDKAVNGILNIIQNLDETELNKALGV